MTYEPRADLAVTNQRAPRLLPPLVSTPATAPATPLCLQVLGPLESASLLGFGHVDQSARHRLAPPSVPGSTSRSRVLPRTLCAIDIYRGHRGCVILSIMLSLNAISFSTAGRSDRG